MSDLRSEVAALQQKASQSPDALRSEVASLQQQKLSGGGSVAGDFATGSSKGIAQAIGGPVDIVTGALNAVLPDNYQIKNPVGGSSSVINLFNKLGIGNKEDYQPEHPFASRVGQEIGSFAANLAPLYAAARYGTTSIPLLDSIREDAMGAAKRDLLTATTAGVGAAAGQQIAPSNPYAETIGELLGGSYPALSPTKNIAHAVIRSLRATFSKEAVTKGAAKVVQGLAKEPRTAATALEKYKPQIPGEQLTSGQVTNNPGLLKLESAIIKKHAEMQGNYSEMGHATNQALQQSAADIGGNVPVTTAQDVVAARRDYLKGLMEARIEQGVQSAQQSLEKITPDRARMEASVVVKNELENALKDAQSQESQLWDKIPKNAVIGTKNVHDAYNNIIEGRAKTANKNDIDPYVTDIFKNDKLGEQASFNDVQTFRSNILQLLRDEKAKDAPNNVKIALLNKLQSAALEDMGVTGAGTEIGNDVKTALDYSRDLNTKFRQGTVGRILGYERTGGKSVAPELTLESLGLGPKHAVATQDILNAVANAPNETQAAIRDSLMSRFMTTVAPQGTIKPSAAETFFRNYGDTLDKFPDLKQSMQQAIKDNTHLDQLTNIYGQRMRSMNDIRKSASALFLNANPNKAVNTVLQSRRPVETMSKIVRLVSKDPSGDALKGLKTAFMQEFMGRAKIASLDQYGSPLLSGQKMEQFFNANKEVIGKSGLFNKEDIGRMAKIIDTAKKLENARNAGTLDQITNAPSDLLTDFVTRIVGANIGGTLGKTTGAPIVAAGAGSRLARMIVGKIPLEKVEDVIAQAVHDKQLMATLLKKPTDKEAPKLIKHIADSSFGLGVTTSENLNRANNQ